MRLNLIELRTIDKRLNEINELTEFDLPEDVLNNIEIELDSIINRLRTSYKYSKFAEMGLKVIK